MESTMLVKGRKGKCWLRNMAMIRMKADMETYLYWKWNFMFKAYAQDNEHLDYEPLASETMKPIEPNMDSHHPDEERENMDEQVSDRETPYRDRSRSRHSPSRHSQSPQSRPQEDRPEDRPEDRQEDRPSAPRRIHRKSASSLRYPGLPPLNSDTNDLIYCVVRNVHEMDIMLAK